jgi:predicted regulator of amino acid metabolism with ACT domain
VAQCFGVGKRTIIEALKNGVELNKLDILMENISDIIEEATVSVTVRYGVKR